MEEVFVKGKQKDDEEKNMSSHTTSDVIIDCHTKEEEKEVAPTIVEEAQLRQKTKRVATLDAFRGLTIVLMILVDDAGGAYSRIDHSPWNGCTLADFVMPFFLFIVGVAIALAFKFV
uniref:Heparan-alpha-glucosaminide N-acetyltransferase catalytic domain-containing protein n=1 Tax=Cucumis sativus TaxID=3659 RepID=A0A0A0LGE0_CUCSA